MTDLPRLVIIEWLDARLPSPKWTLLEDVLDPKPLKAKSVGWLVRDGDVKVLVQTVGDVDDHPQGTGMVHIPACMVTAVHDLGIRFYFEDRGTKMEMTDD
jgi:hypothetical protein